MFRLFLQSELGKALIRLFSASIATIALFCGLYFGLWSQYRTGVTNAGFVCFGVAFVLGFLSLGNKYCFFTPFQYGFSYMFGSLGRYYRMRNGGTYGDFVESKNERKKEISFPYLPYFAVALFWLVLALAFNPWNLSEGAVADLPVAVKIFVFFCL